MQPDELYQKRQKAWARLSHLLDRSEKQLQSLLPLEVSELGALYREITSDLAIAQRDFPDHRITTYLNQLVARGHTVVYQGEPMALKRIKAFILIGFPQTYRRNWPFILLATLFFLIPALVGAGFTYYAPDTAKWFLPSGTESMAEMIEDQELWVNIPVAERPYVSSFIARNNIQVSFLAFGSGILLGIPTLWVMLMNGSLLGGISGLTFHYGVGFDLWTFVIGHGVIELSVIFMAGGAGLRLGWSLIQPKGYKRRAALTQAAQEAIRLVLPCVPLLLFAGAIEGFISPAENIPWPMKWGIGLLSGIVLYGYLFLAGRSQPKAMIIDE